MQITRAAQREATRQAMLEAAVDLMSSEGLAAVSTRRIADAVKVSQSAVMYHFPTRLDLHAGAVRHLADAIESDARRSVQEALLAGPPDAERMIDLAWRIFATPRALAVAQVWMAAGAEPAYVETVRALELKIVALGLEAMGPFADQFEDEAALFAFMDTAFSVIRGLVISVPVWSMGLIEERWQGSKRVLLGLMPPAR
ncbi:MAG: helix-turn-helix domain containing protein [Propionibacteriales bacterium]|nr:helix-turn-helix domain containing protein [Propionibacteriales bacterium]